MISIDWGARIIFVPKADLTLVQLTPTEIYNMDLNWFRLQLKDLEDGEDGICFPNTHNHSTEVSLGGITFARVIEIINDYTVTFEDGQYAVNLIGANSNVGDRVNVNQVSVRSNNSAGLTSSPIIEYASFNDGVTVDVNSSTVGTTYPAGTPLSPVNNLQDALTIAEFRGFSKFFVKSSMSITNVGVYDGIDFCGDGYAKTHLDIESGASVVNCKFTELSLAGEFSGEAYIDNCFVRDISGFGGDIRNSFLGGLCVLASGIPTNFVSCVDGIPGTGTPSVDLTYATDFGIWGYNGGVRIINSTNPATNVSLNVSAGRIIIESSVTAGTYLIKGVGLCLDNSTGSAVVNIDGLISKSAVVSAINDEIGLQIEYASFGGGVWIDTVSGTSGVEYPIGTLTNPVNNINDAKAIAIERGFNTINILSNLTVTSGTNIDYYTIKSNDWWLEVHVEPGVSCYHTNFEKLSLFGELSGIWNVVYDCWVYEITNFSGWLIGGSFVEISLAPYNSESLGQSWFDSIVPMYPNEYSIINMNVDTDISLTELNGFFKIINCIDGCFAEFGFSTGSLLIDNSCTGGEIIVRGMGALIDNSVGTSVDYTGLISKASMSEAVWDESLVNHTLLGSTGEVQAISIFFNSIHIDTVSGVSGTNFPIGTKGLPVNNMTDALFISSSVGINVFHVVGELVSDNDVSDLSIIGCRGFVLDSFDFNNRQYDNVVFEKIKLTGTINGTNHTFSNCFIQDVDNISGESDRCRLKDSVKIKPGGLFSGVGMVFEGDNTTIDMGSVSGTSVSLDIDSGCVNFVNSVDGCLIEINMRGGEITLDSSCVGGEFYIEGYGTLFGNPEALGMTVKGNHLISLETISEETWSNEKALRILGLLQENQYLDQTVYITYNGQKLLTSGRIRTYSDSASVGTNSNIIASYQITTTWTGDEMQSYKAVKT